MISYVSWCCAVCNWSKVVSLLSYTAASLFSTRNATTDTGARAGSVGIGGGSIFYLIANTECPEFHKPKCADSWHQNRVRSYFVLHTFWVTTSQAHKQQQNKETTVNSYNTIFPSQLHNIPFRVSNAAPVKWVSISTWYLGMCKLLFKVVLMSLPNITLAVHDLQLNITN